MKDKVISNISHSGDEASLLNEFDRGWLIGVIDSDGSLCLVKRKYKRNRLGYSYLPILCIATTSEKLVKRCASLIGASWRKSSPDTRNNRKPMWEMMAYSGILRVLLPKIVDDLIVKKQQATLLIESLNLLEENRNWTKAPENFKRLDEIRGIMVSLNR